MMMCRKVAQTLNRESKYLHRVAELERYMEIMPRSVEGSGNDFRFYLCFVLVEYAVL
jgi:hypothetical protein